MGSNYSVVLDALRKASSQNAELLKIAEQQLKCWETQAGFYSTVITVACDKYLDTNIRWLAVLCLKNGVERYCKRPSGSISNEEKEILRRKLLDSFSEPINQGLGTLSEKLQPFLLSMIALSTDVSQPPHVYLLEGGLELWWAVLDNSSTCSSELLNLGRNIIPLLGFQCIISADGLSALDFHRDEVTKLFICHYCPYSTTNKGHMRDHQRRHSGEKPFTCEHCGRGFTQKSSLKSHMFVHSGVKRFKCSFCKYGFSTKCNYTKHLAMHCKGKPYQCPVCKKRFMEKTFTCTHD